jgi:hypothetical protein
MKSGQPPTEGVNIACRNRLEMEAPGVNQCRGIGANVWPLATEVTLAFPRARKCVLGKNQSLCLRSNDRDGVSASGGSYVPRGNNLPATALP